MISRSILLDKAIASGALVADRTGSSPARRRRYPDEPIWSAAAGTIVLSRECLYPNGVLLVSRF